MNVPLRPPPGWSFYSRAAWTELQLQFRLPREPVISTRLRDYASQEEIDTVIAAVQQIRREVIAVEKRPAVKSASKAARDDAALAMIWAAADRQELNRLLTDLRRGEMPSNFNGRMIALPQGPARAPRPLVRRRSRSSAGNGRRPRSMMLPGRRISD
jgi:hypothetical protein